MMSTGGRTGFFLCFMGLACFALTSCGGGDEGDAAMGGGSDGQG
jgi:hypothetical protein